MQLVNDRLSQSAQRSLGRPGDVENHNPVLAFLEPAARQEERLLWSYVPETSQAVAVNPYEALAP